jgi:alkanesulfonate monooxygenase
MPLATATGAAGNSTALVGSPATVAAAMLDYYDIGVTTFLIRGYDPYEDLQGYGEVISLVRDGGAQREGAGSQYDLQARR